MREIIISENESGKRLDKFLSQYFTGTTMGFLFKMLRKKNITLNKKKATGKEVLKKDDVISVFFSDDTFEKFANKFVSGSSKTTNEYNTALESIGPLEIIYEDEHILLVNKPAGILTQKSQQGDASINEWLIGYLLKNNSVTVNSLSTFRPSVCNRLDRNTSGIVICSKSLSGAREMARILKDRSLHKYYRTIVSGKLKEGGHIHGYLYKDESKNQVKLYDSPLEGTSEIETSYNIINNILLNGVVDKELSDFYITELEVLLHTGKTHQIRAHLSSIGHPILGDPKYGYRKINDVIRKKFGLKYQLLHAERLVFPELSGDLAYLTGKEFKAKLPDIFKVFTNDSGK